LGNDNSKPCLRTRNNKSINELDRQAPHGILFRQGTALITHAVFGQSFGTTPGLVMFARVVVTL
jgi:hypothetical protein